MRNGTILVDWVGFAGCGGSGCLAARGIYGAYAGVVYAGAGVFGR